MDTRAAVHRRWEEQARLVFRWIDGQAEYVKLVDYHQEVKMPPQNRTPTHPGEILLEEFWMPLGVTQVAFAAHLGVPIQRINELVRGKRGVTPDTAWLLALALNTTP